MAAFIGYYVDRDSNQGVPMAAATTYAEALQKTIVRSLEYFGVCMGPWDELQVQRLEITHEQAAELDKSIADHIERKATEAEGAPA